MSDIAARTLSARLEALASAIERSGASPSAVARLLESASVATMNALALDALTGRATAPAVTHRADELPAVAELRDAA
jgi:hypothetical protein